MYNNYVVMNYTEGSTKLLQSNYVYATFVLGVHVLVACSVGLPLIALIFWPDLMSHT